MTDLADAVTAWPPTAPTCRPPFSSADLGELAAAYARYDADDVARALWATVELFERIEREIGRPPAVPHAEVRQYLRTVLNGGTTDG